jgi:poly(3-hydroxybutyrate) depolymerase/lysophospholipase L1-like esterase
MKRLAALAWLLATAAFAQQTTGLWHINVDIPKAERRKLLAEAIQAVGARGSDLPSGLQVKEGDRIVAMGDSITAGGGYLRYIGKALLDSYPALGVSNVVNVGVSGQKAENMVDRFQKDVVDRKPTIVTINVGINDVWHRLGRPHDDAVLQKYHENVAKMVDMAQGTGARVILLAPTIIQEDSASEGNRRLPMYADAMRSIAAEKKCAFADLHGMFIEALKRKPADQTRWLTGDGVHMGARGNAIMALGVLRALGVPDEKSGSVEFDVPPPAVSPAAAFEACIFEAPGATNAVLRYRYGKPRRTEPGRKYPLVLCLHGAGERGADNAKQVGHFRPILDAIAAATPCYVVIPQVPADQRWATYGWSAQTEDMQDSPTQVLALTKQLIESLVASEPVDRDKIYVTGLSMGGYGTWEAIQRWPDFFAAAVPVCGGGDVKTAPKVKGLPIWAWHGDADPTINVSKTIRMIDAITEAGGDPKATYIQNGGHAAWVNAYRDPELVKWLLKQRRGQAQGGGAGADL